MTAPSGYGVPSHRTGTVAERTVPGRAVAVVAVAAAVVARIAVAEPQRILRKPIGTIQRIRVSDEGEGQNRKADR